MTIANSASPPSLNVDGATLLHGLRRIEDRLAKLEDLVGQRTKPLLTVDEVAELTGRAPFTVRRWIAEGRIVATRVSGTGPRGRLLIQRAELDKLLVVGLGGDLSETESAVVNT